MLVIHGEQLVGHVEPKSWNMTGEDGKELSGVSHQIQTLAPGSDGRVQVRLIKCTPEQHLAAKTMVGQAINIQVEAFARGNGISYKAVGLPTKAQVR